VDRIGARTANPVGGEMAMCKFRLAPPTIVLIGGLMISTGASLGKVEYTKKEKKPCTTCHVKANSKELNDVGKCYKENNHSLKGCESKKAEEKKS
jgi:hypothetical protein